MYLLGNKASPQNYAISNILSMKYLPVIYSAQNFRVLENEGVSVSYKCLSLLQSSLVMVTKPFEAGRVTDVSSLVRTISKISAASTMLSSWMPMEVQRVSVETGS